ncbi:serine/threonine protein kinase, partial [Striga asiatica]
ALSFRGLWIFQSQKRTFLWVSAEQFELLLLVSHLLFSEKNMRMWWGKSSSKESKKKTTKESFINTLHKKFKSPESKSSGRSGAAVRIRSSDTVSERGSHSSSQSPTKNVARSQSLAERAQAQPLPLPGLGSANVFRTDSAKSEPPARPKQKRASKPSLFLPLPRPACIRHRLEPTDLDGDLAVASISSECSVESDDRHDSHLPSPSSNSIKDQSPFAPHVPKELPLPKRRPLSRQVANLQVPPRSVLYSAPDSSISSPSRSPIRPSNEQAANLAFPAGKLYPEHFFLGSGQCSSPGSAETSGHNSVGGDLLGQLFWQPSRGSPEYSPNPSPRMTSPGPGSRIQSGAVTPLHPRVGDDGKQKSHRLPLPPVTISNSSPFSHSNSAATSPSVPRSPGRAENLVIAGSRWKKGKLLGRGTFGHVYVGFNSETGEMCAMKEEIALLSRLKHPNIVHYYGSETVDDKLYIYLEYVSGGSIHKILQEYGKLGESAIRSYTQQILSGLAYLHAKNTVHRDIKGANILVDPNGRVKLADFGMAKHISGQSCPLSFKGSPYWMAPEVIRNSNGSSLPVDIWSLGCTVLEMATSKPPWSQYEGVAAMFKIGNSKELPTIPEHLSNEGKEFVKLCLQRNPQHRPTATQLLEHSFVKNLEKNISPSDHPPHLNNVVKSTDNGHARSLQQLDTEGLAIHSFRASKSNFHSSDIYISRNISCPVSPIGSPLLRPRSPRNLNGMMSPSPISSPRTTSGTSQGYFGNLTKQPMSPRAYNSPSYWDPDILLGRPVTGEIYDGRSGLGSDSEMSRYDNWERLVAAVLKKEQLWQLFHAQSRSPSSSSESSGFSFELASSPDDVNFSFWSPDRSASDRRGGDNGGVGTAAAAPSSTVVKDQPSVENLSPKKKLFSTAATRKRDLRIQVPKPLVQHYGAFSPKPCSPVHFSRLHPRTAGGHFESPADWPVDAQQQCYPLPLPPEPISNSSPLSHPNSATASPKGPLYSPERAESHKSPDMSWKRGKLLGVGAFGNVYLGFNSEKGKMCAMKEFYLQPDGAMPNQSVMLFRTEIALLSTLKHPNIVSYYGSEMVGGNVYVYFEYVAGGCIQKVLKEYGKLGESAIRIYTQQILLGLAYLHSKSITHGDIRGATVLIDPNGGVKLSCFGIERKIAVQSRPSLLTDSSYWMAPEVIMNPNTCNRAMDIWSLGCTIIEMATSEPPLSQYKKGGAMFKVAYHKELPSIPNHLSDEGKDFVRRCLHDISAPVSPIGSVLPHSTSPKNPNTQNFLPLKSSSPGVNSAVWYSHLNRPLLPPEAFRDSPKHMPGTNITPYWDPEILQRAKHSRENKKLGSAANEQVKEQLVMADRVLQQLFRAPMTSHHVDGV